MKLNTTLTADGPVHFPRSDGSRIPFKVYGSPEIYRLEQERIFRGPVWSFVAMEAEIPKPNDFKSTFVGDTPIVVTRGADGSLAAWVNRCAHRGALVCRAARGNTKSHVCVYHQWSYDTRGNLRGVPFRNGIKGSAGMPADFEAKEHGLQRLRVESYRGLVFATFSDSAPSLVDYLGPKMCERLDRIFHKPIVYLGCTRQYARSNWKLYSENVCDPYHASLLHPFFSTFNLVRAATRVENSVGERGLHCCIMIFHTEDASEGAAYKDAKNYVLQRGSQAGGHLDAHKNQGVRGRSRFPDPVDLPATGGPANPEQPGHAASLAQRPGQFRIDFQLPRICRRYS
jgi:anthranilate 1,2-dioxygenase large subunit